MFIKNLLLFIMFGLPTIQAATSTSESDVYGDKVPNPITMRGIRYTAPALQGINKNHLSLEDIEKIVTSQSASKLSQYIHQGNICLLLRKSEDGLITEIASVWKEN